MEASTQPGAVQIVSLRNVLADVRARGERLMRTLETQDD